MMLRFSWPAGLYRVDVAIVPPLRLLEDAGTQEGGNEKDSRACAQVAKVTVQEDQPDQKRPILGSFHLDRSFWWRPVAFLGAGSYPSQAQLDPRIALLDVGKAIGMLNKAVAVDPSQNVGTWEAECAMIALTGPLQGIEKKRRCWLR